MVGNKSDLDAQRDVTFDEAKQFAEENGTYVIERCFGSFHQKLIPNTDLIFFFLLLLGQCSSKIRNTLSFQIGLALNLA